MVDTNITDTCISHLKGNPWWLSPDIELTSASSQADQAEPNQINPVRLTFHRQANCVLPAGAKGVRMRLWVGGSDDPQVAMTPNNSASAVRLNSSDILVLVKNLPAAGPVSPPVFNWTPTGAGVQATGHRCLIVQSWPDRDGPPDPNAFHAFDDPHHAQRNIAICPCLDCEFALGTANVHLAEPEAVTLRVVVDPRPPTTILARLLPTLLSHEVMDQLGGPGLRDGLRRRGVLRPLPSPRGGEVPWRPPPNLLGVLDELAGQGILRLAPNPPERFGLRLPDFPDARVLDHSNPDAGRFGRLGSPNWQAGLRLAPNQYTRFTFWADLSRSTRGDVHVFHVSQRGQGGRLQGGITLVGVEL